MGIPDKPLPARGVKLYFIVNQDIQEGERSSWRDAVSRSSPLANWFGRVDFAHFGRPTLISPWLGWNLVKILCVGTHILVKPSEAKSAYNQIFQQSSTWFARFCGDRGIECRPYDFRVLFRLHPPENPGEFVTIPSLDGVVGQVVSPTSLMSMADPPANPEEMLRFAETTGVLGGQALGVAIQHAARCGWEVYAGYGVRTEESANTYELDTLEPSTRPADAESMQSLQGELSARPISESGEEAPQSSYGVLGIGISKDAFRCDACQGVTPWPLFGGVIVNPFTPKEGFHPAIPENLRTIIESDRKLLTDSAGDYTSRQTQNLMAEYLAPLDWKTLYPTCMSCIKILDDGFDVVGFNDAVETEIVDKLNNWFDTSFILVFWPDELGRPEAGVLASGSLRPMTSFRPVNMIRVRVIRLFANAKQEERQAFLEQPEIFVAKFHQELKVLLEVHQAAWNRTFDPAETKEAGAKVQSILEAQGFFARLHQAWRGQRGLSHEDE